MASELDEIQDMPEASSTAGEDGAQAKAATETAASSPAADDQKTGDDDLLSVVRDVATRSKAPEASSAEAPEPDPEPEDERQTEPEKPDDENFSDVPFHRHPRFRQVLGRMKAAEADAGRYRNVQQFLDDNGLGGEEAAEALVVAGLAKMDPAAAFERVLPWFQQLAIAAGKALPNDLRQRVQAGELTEAGAAEIAKLQAERRSFEMRTQLAEQQRIQREQASAQTALMDAANAWEADRTKKDPNFGAKLPALQKELVWLHSREGRPTTPEGVRDQLNRAYRAINQQVGAAPAKPAVRPVTSGTSTPAAPAAKPQSTLDIVRSVAQRKAG